VVASLAGVDDDDTWRALSLGDRTTLAGLRQRVRALPKRRQRAEALLAERMRVLSTAALPATPHDGARLFAAWLRTVDGALRARVLRALSEADQRYLAEVLPHAVALTEAQQTDAAWFVAAGTRCFERMPTLNETAAVLRSLRGLSTTLPPPVAQWERTLRVFDRREACVRLAQAVEAP
jgi:hypothetical protein